ncbi:MAG: hypothetical protein BWZ08_02563 [candidate division BRC1 bacterium ADurb.BinA292]|nr:MAG: hypothetical protein BWZ08_02563 [candidate division BRC1 bacterium ADurb.BinA292]
MAEPPAQIDGSGAQDGRRTARTLRPPRGRRGLRLRPRFGLAAGVRGVVHLSGDPRSARGDPPDQGQHVRAAPDGPAGLRRRRLRQDGSRHPGGVQGDGREAPGRAARPDDAPCPAALQYVFRAAGRLPVQGRDDLALPLHRADQRDPAPTEGGRDRPGHRDAPAALARRAVSRPGPADRGRGTALRRGAEGKNQEPAGQRRHPDADGHADPANALHGAVGPARPEHHHDPPGQSPPDQDADDPLRPRADRGGDPARTESRRPGLLRPQPDRDDPGRRPDDPRNRPARADRRRPRPDGRAGPGADHARIHRGQV